MYTILDENDEHAARALLILTAPQNYEILQVQKHSLDFMGNGVWSCSVDYGFGDQLSSANPKEGGSGGGGGNEGNQAGGGDPVGPHINVTIGSRQQHITQSLQTINTVQRQGDARILPNHNGAIGVHKGSRGGGGGGVEGCDIAVPDFKWSESWKFNPFFITWDYLWQLQGLVGRVNGKGQTPFTYSGVFRNRAKGEVMFLGADVEAQSGEWTKFVFHFHAESNVADFQLNDQMPVIDKKGHEYLWVEYEDDTDAKNPLKVPRAVYVEEVGRESSYVDDDNYLNRRDFRRIGIGW